VSGAGKEWMESMVKKRGQTGPFDARKKDRGFNRPVVKPLEAINNNRPSQFSPER